MFHPDFSLENINNFSKGCMVEHLGIEIYEIGNNFIKGKMPVDHRTKQPLGLLHGGASVALAETLGSIASTACLNPNTHFAVGLEINANHIKSARDGFVYGTATPIHTGRNTHVWEIKIVNDNYELVCVSRITLAIMDRR